MRTLDEVRALVGPGRAVRNGIFWEGVERCARKLSPAELAEMVKGAGVMAGVAAQVALLTRGAVEDEARRLDVIDALVFAGKAQTQFEGVLGRLGRAGEVQRRAAARGRGGRSDADSALEAARIFMGAAERIDWRQLGVPAADAPEDALALLCAAYEWVTVARGLGWAVCGVAGRLDERAADALVVGVATLDRVRCSLLWTTAHGGCGARPGVKFHALPLVTRLGAAPVDGQAS